MGVIKNKNGFLYFITWTVILYFVSFYPIEESIRLSFMEWNGIGDKTLQVCKLCYNVS